MSSEWKERDLAAADVAAPLCRGAGLQRHDDRAPWLHRRTLFAITASLFVGVVGCLTSCQTAGLRHEFTGPALNWEARIGQLQYRGPKTTLIGEVLVRYSKSGDFELTFSKGPGVTLLLLHQDANFARVEGPLARGRWAGPIEKAPPRLRGWIALRDRLMQTQKSMLKYSNDSESFVFEF